MNMIQSFLTDTQDYITDTIVSIVEKSRLEYKPLEKIEINTPDEISETLKTYIDKKLLNSLETGSCTFAHIQNGYWTLKKHENCYAVKLEVLNDIIDTFFATMKLNYVKFSTYQPYYPCISANHIADMNFVRTLVVCKVYDSSKSVI